MGDIILSSPPLLLLYSPLFLSSSPPLFLSSSPPLFPSCLPSPHTRQMASCTHEPTENIGGPDLGGSVRVPVDQSSYGLTDRGEKFAWIPPDVDHRLR